MAEHADVIEKVGTLPDQIAAEIAGLSEDKLRWREDEGAWSIKEVCGHLRDDSEVWRRRLEMMITEAAPALPAYDQETLVRERAYQDADIAAVIGDFRRFRLEMVDALAALGPDDWMRTGQHPDWGPMTIREGMERMIRHTEGHLVQVRELKVKAAGI